MNWLLNFSMTTPKTVKIKRSYHSESDPANESSRPFRFKQQAVKKWHLIAAYGLIWLAISAMFAVLYGAEITAETIARNIFPIRIAIVLGALISATLLSILLHLYFRKLKLLEERDRLIAEIRDDSAKIKILRGLLSVCSYCKKVRNSEGNWEQIEEYITNNSHAEFSHGVCPECMAKLDTEICSLHVAVPADKNKYAVAQSNG